MDKHFLEFLATTHNMSLDDLRATVVKQGDDNTEQIDIEALKDLDAQRVAKFKTEAKERFDSGHQKGKSEALTAFERQLRTDFAIDDALDLRGVDLVKHLLAKASQAEGLTPEKVKAHPTFIEREHALMTEREEAVKAAKQQLAELEAKYLQKEMFAQVAPKALALLDTFNPVLPESPTAKQTLLNLYQRNFEGVEVKEDGFVWLNGTRQEDRHGNPVKFDAYAKSVAANLFDFAAANPAGNGGNANNGGEGGDQSFAIPKSMKEYEDRYFDSQTSREEKRFLVRWYESQQNN